MQEDIRTWESRRTLAAFFFAVAGGWAYPSSTAWLIYELTGDRSMLSLLFDASTVAALLFSVPVLAAIRKRQGGSRAIVRSLSFIGGAGPPVLLAATVVMGVVEPWHALIAQPLMVAAAAIPAIACKELLDQAGYSGRALSLGAGLTVGIALATFGQPLAMLWSETSRGLVSSPLSITRYCGVACSLLACSLLYVGAGLLASPVVLPITGGIGLILGLGLWIMTETPTRGPGAPLLGWGALVIPLVIGPACLTAGWAMLAAWSHRRRRWAWIGIGAALVCMLQALCLWLIEPYAVQVLGAIFSPLLISPPNCQDRLVSASVAIQNCLVNPLLVPALSLLGGLGYAALVGGLRMRGAIAAATVAVLYVAVGLWNPMVTKSPAAMLFLDQWTGVPPIPWSITTLATTVGNSWIGLHVYMWPLITVTPLLAAGPRGPAERPRVGIGTFVAACVILPVALAIGLLGPILWIGLMGLGQL